MNDPSEKKFRILNHTMFSWIFLWGMMVVFDTFIPPFGADRFTRLMVVVAYSIVIALVYWVFVRCFPRWVLLNDKGIKVGRTLYSHSEVESISVEGKGKRIRISPKRVMFPISIFPIKSERCKLDKAVTVWANQLGITVIHS